MLTLDQLRARVVRAKDTTKLVLKPSKSFVDEIFFSEREGYLGSGRRANSFANSKNGW